MKRYLKKIPAPLRTKKALFVYAGVLSVFLLANVTLGVAYRNKSYPNTLVAGRDVSGVPHGELQDTLASIGLLPGSVTLKYQEKDTDVKTEALGVQVDTDKTSQAITDASSWLPIWNIITKRDISFSTKVDDEKLQKYIESFIKKQEKGATDAKIVIKNGEFTIAPEKAGHTLEADQTKASIVDGVARGNREIALQARKIDPKVTKEKLEEKLQQVKKQQQTSVTLKFGDKTKIFTSAEIAVMFDAEDGNIDLADANIQAAVTRTGQGFGILVENTAQAVAAIKQAVSRSETLTFTLIEKPRPTLHYSYCVAARGVATSYLNGLSAKLASVYADARGWGLKGQITLSKASSGCNFTVWLSAASQMPTFGAICDSTWSCRVGPNVVINFDRWQGATTAWNNAGGSLEDYRVMVINHETGHWFGYYHSYCGGAGQPAPVMQQQSIDLQGCKFNPWPTAGELASHRQSLGL